MAHYALLDSNNIVTGVITGKDDNDGTNWEIVYSLIHGQRCIQTSYNTHKGIHKLGGVPFRKNYAGIGYSYDKQRDAFIPPKPFPSWQLNEDTCHWESPVPRPNDQTNPWVWEETSQTWIIDPTP